MSEGVLHCGFMQPQHFFLVSRDFLNLKIVLSIGEIFKGIEIKFAAFNNEKFDGQG